MKRWIGTAGAGSLPPFGAGRLAASYDARERFYDRTMADYEVFRAEATRVFIAALIREDHDPGDEDRS